MPPCTFYHSNSCKINPERHRLSLYCFSYCAPRHMKRDQNSKITIQKTIIVNGSGYRGRHAALLTYRSACIVLQNENETINYKFAHASRPLPMMQSSLNRHLHLFKKPKSRLALVSPTTATVTGVGDGVVRLLTIDAVDDTSVSSVFSVCTEFLVVAVDRRSASMVVAFVPFIFSTLSGCSIGCLSSRNDSDKICN